MPRGTSRQVKPRPKQSKGKKQHAHKSRQKRLGGTRSQRLHAARTQLPHLQPPCSCPCPETVLPGQPAAAEPGDIVVLPIPMASPSVGGTAGPSVIANPPHPTGGPPPGAHP
jgi:hypothetical protein